MRETSFFSRAAPLYDVAMRVRPLAGLATFLGPVEGLVVEPGGGTGLVTARILRENAGARGVIVDVSEGMLRRARTRGLDVVMGDAHRLPLHDGAADLVVLAESLHHFTGPEAALREAARVVRPGGRLFIDDFHPRSRVTRFLIRPFERLIGSPFAVRRPDTVQATLEGGCGLRLRNARGLHGFRYWQLYERP